AARLVLARLLRTTGERVFTFARLAVALLLFPHGAQHALGWFGGYGFQGTHGWMTKTLGFPAPAAAVAILTEIVAPLALAVGLGGRLAALGTVGIMLGALSTHFANGFFMNWFGALPAGQEGFEYHLLMIALSLVIVVKGSGAWSLDRRLHAKFFN
ncbi:MAG TPA: DoxX family protein, partial [Polyangia bacterium]|nr:DoxX family protein [Polyangia bacterium]